MNTKQEQIKCKVATTTIIANISSGDFDIKSKNNRVNKQGIADLRGDGEFIMKIRRFIPDFISQTGSTQVTLNLRDFPNDTQS